MKVRILSFLFFVLFSFSLFLTSCNKTPSGSQTPPADLGTDDTSFGESLEESGVYDGIFEGEGNIGIVCLSGNAEAYTLSDGVLIFSGITEDSVYQLSGDFSGNIVVNVDEGVSFELELSGFSMISKNTSPIVVEGGEKFTLSAKKDTKNYIYDQREALGETTEEGMYRAAIHTACDFDIEGKGELFVLSENNNGMHSSDDLEVKNLTLFVKCADNALKGNDSVLVESGALTLIATKGDTVKTEASDISQKGNQRGNVSFLGGTHTLYAACDGIDAAYDVIIEEGVTLNIYTDKYSSYSEEVTAVSGDSYYIRFTYSDYKYSVKYYNSDSDYLFVDATYHSTVSGGRTNYYYYAFDKHPEYAKMKFIIYSEDMEMSSEEDYLAMTDYLTPSESYDTFALTPSYDGIYYSWTNYTTTVSGGGMGGPGGMGGSFGTGEGNSEKGDHSTKGIKSANAIRISGGTVTVKSYDDALHANAETTLENGETPKGDITISGGTLTLYSNDDGLHADGTLTVSGGTVAVTYSYEGAEGANVKVSGGNVSIASRDDGINATSTTGSTIEISDGRLYIYAGGDGIDSNSRTSYSGIVFSGGDTVVISTSSGNSAIDTEAGYSYTGGRVLALMPSGGMSSEATHCSDFSSIGKISSLSVNSGAYVSVGDVCEVKIPSAMSAKAIYLGDSSISITTKNNSKNTLDNNGVWWK